MMPSICTRCGHRLQAAGNFCSGCGAATAKSLPYLISVQRVVLMSLLSGGLYLFWWFYITWKHYHFHTRKEAFPVWHALTLLVPIYSLFRIHAHMRTYRELMTELQLTSTINPGVAVAVVLIASLFAYIGFRQTWSGEISEAAAFIILVAEVTYTVSVAWLLASVQGNINRYWQTVSPSATSCRLGIGEVILTGLGIVFWADTLATAFIDSWRTL